MDTGYTGSGFPLSKQIIQDYNIVRMLGKGGMGEVYLAEQLRVGRRRVALKVLSRACSDDPEIIKRFENEAASAGRIHHRNVVMIFESRVTDDGQIYVVMEYVDGNSLRHEIADRGALPLEEIVDITKQICAGLNVAHKRAIVHRDIKPDNIMLGRDEEGALIVKVLDFGIARLLEPGAGGSQTKSGVIMGTPFYMSPEQALGNTGDKIDARSDIYSLGMVVYQMLTGRVAFESDSWMRVMYKHINERPLPPSQLRPQLGFFREVEDVVLKALEKDRDDRQQSVTELATQLEAAYNRAKAANPEGALTVSYGSTALSDGLAFAHTGSPVSRSATIRDAVTPSTEVEPVATTAGAVPKTLWTRRNTIAALVVVVVLALTGLARFVFMPGTDPDKSETTTSVPSIRPSPMPAIETFDYDVLTVTPTGQLSEVHRREARYFNEDLGSPLTIEMVEIPNGTYLMGAPPETQKDRHPNERPQHQVTVSMFYMSRYEVTQAQWLAVSKLPKVNRELELNPSGFKGDAKLPVQNVSWWEAVEFCERLSKATGRTYRLPTEAEWEYACRAGTTTPFYFGETITAEIVNYDANYPFGAGPKGVTRKQPIPVGNTGAPNAFGLHNTHGNMAEWCLDPWHDNYIGAPRDGMSWEDGGNQSLRVFRGGSWYDGGDNCRSAFRNSYAPDVKLSFIGLRVVMVPQK
ncbi:MAG TPA: bifunctional serine/threonine-protein kinase/formylglycine-generating enzyme family protein [Blastocatellia bacterium]|nr:bifunctional serine/threonine-protein kinase/formylglycine-generating enzyme family protein [Blastocatellia bacterium]